jgi:hypothetical protein
MWIGYMFRPMRDFVVDRQSLLFLDIEGLVPVLVVEPVILDPQNQKKILFFSVSFGLEGGGESLESPLHEMVEGVWEVVFCIFLVYSMLPLR